MRGEYGAHVRNSLTHQAANHKEIIERNDAFLLAILRTERLIALKMGVAEADLPPDYADLTQNYLFDLVAINKIKREEAAAREEQAKRNREQNRNPRRRRGG